MRPTQRGPLCLGVSPAARCAGPCWSRLGCAAVINSPRAKPVPCGSAGGSAPGLLPAGPWPVMWLSPKPTKWRTGILAQYVLANAAAFELGACPQSLLMVLQVRVSAQGAARCSSDEGHLCVLRADTDGCLVSPDADSSPVGVGPHDSATHPPRSPGPIFKCSHTGSASSSSGLHGGWALSP